MPSAFADRLRRLFDWKAYSLPDPAFPLELFGGAPTVAGVHVTPESAMRVPAVAAAVRLISEAAGSIPAKVFTRDPKDAAPDHPAYALVHDWANEWTSAASLREHVTADALSTGNGYARAIVVGRQVQELHRLDPRSVTHGFDAAAIIPVFTVGHGADAITYPFNEIVHVTDFHGCASATRGREAIGLTSLLERHTSKLFAKGARPSGIVAFNQQMPPEAVAKVQAAWNAAHSGENAGGTAFIDGTGGATFSTITPTAQASELTQQRGFQIDEIARHFNVPPTMLYSLGRATWGNVEQLALQARDYRF